MRQILIVIAVMTFIYVTIQESYGQVEKGFPEEKYKKNTIKWNLSPFLLWGYPNFNFSYERVLKQYRSFSVNAGIFHLPSTGIYDSLNIPAAKKQSGFTISGDYRFYFKKRNLHQAPDGLYWGPYASFHHYQFENDITVINNPNIQGKIDLDGNVNIFSAGVELGYQFIIKERLSIDLVFMGPSLSVYSGGLKLGGQLTSEEYEDYLNAIRDILTSKLPLLDELIKEGGFNDKGVSTSIGFGLRYLIQIGYRF